MKKLFNLPFVMLLCAAMVTVFTSCEEEETKPQLAFHCDGKTITDGGTYTTPSMAPDINLIGEVDGKVVVVIKSLNQTSITMCAFEQCVATLSIFDYEATDSGEIIAGTAHPLGIHYTPTDDSKTHRAEALITAYYEGYETEAVSFKLVMTNAKEE